MALALALGRRRIAGPRFHADIETHLADRVFEIARNVDRQRLERRHIERMQALSATVLELAERRQEARQGLAAAGGRDQEHRAALRLTKTSI